MLPQKSIIKALREKFKLKQREFAKKVGVTQGAIAIWEKMGIETPKGADLAVCKAFKMELWELYSPESVKVGSGLTEKELKFIAKFRELTEDKKKTIENIMEW